MRPAPDAAIFDLDGVVTFTARLHSEAWKQLFDEFLRSRAEATGEPFRPFTDADYNAYVDGRPRLDGIRTFLASRGITLPEGTSSDPPDAETVAGLGHPKNRIFRALLVERGVDVDGGAVRLIRELRERGVRVGVASSSKNTPLILETAGLESLFEARVDGITSEELGLRGKPAPDIFLACLERLGARDPGRAVVVEDAVSGVEAGRAGGFGLDGRRDRADQAIARQHLAAAVPDVEQRHRVAHHVVGAGEQARMTGDAAHRHAVVVMHDRVGERPPELRADRVVATGRALVDLGRDDSLVGDDFAVLAVKGDLEAIVGDADVAPLAPDTEVDLRAQHLTAVRVPPALDELRLGDCSEHEVPRCLELPRDEDLVVRGERDPRGVSSCHWHLLPPS